MPYQDQDRESIDQEELALFPIHFTVDLKDRVNLLCPVLA